MKGRRPAARNDEDEGPMSRDDDDVGGGLAKTDESVYQSAAGSSMHACLTVGASLVSTDRLGVA